MERKLTRRALIKTFTFGAAVAPAACHRRARAASPNSRLNLACVGAAGKGWEDLIGSSGDGKLHNVVALCDIDHRDGGDQPDNLGKGQAARPLLGIGQAARKFPDAKRYADFRRMLEQKDIEAVTVSTPDHMHATIALTAMALGKHVYVQKPLTQTVHESRVMREFAKAKGVVTQMGNQSHSSAGYRCLVKVIRDGVIGRVKEAHAWTSSPSWPQGMGLPPGEDPVPEGVHWDLWIGVAKPRPYKHQVYHNFNWRGWREFGGGSLGDMGCHIMDPVVWSLELGPPRLVSARVSGVNDQSYPEWSNVSYVFPATKYAADGFKLTWYDGKKQPPIEIARMPAGSKLPTNGSLFIGEKGVLVTAHTPTVPRLYPEEDFRDYSRGELKKLFEGFEPMDHYRAWTDAILAGRQANSPFDYAGPLNETVMLGTIAQRLPERTFAWNAGSLTLDDPAATALVRRSYRKGWEIAALVGFSERGVITRIVRLAALGLLTSNAVMAGPWRSYEIYEPAVEIGNVYDGAAGPLKYNHCATVAWYRDRWFTLWNANTVPIEAEPAQPVVLSTSCDFKTWSEPIEPFNDPAHCLNPVKLATGRQWQPNLAVVGDELWCVWCQSSGGDAGCYFSRLCDPDGKWENRRLEFGDEAVIDGVRYDRLFPTQNPCVLLTGRVLAPVTIRGPRMDVAVATDPWRKERKRDSVLYTDDRGATWHLSPGATIPGQEWACWEPTVWQSGDGLVRMFARNNNWADGNEGGDPATKMLARSMSRDGGATWMPHEFVPIETVCSRAHVLPLPGGRFVMVMNDWKKGRFASDRQNLALFFNRGGGWDFTPGVRVCGQDTRVAYPQMFVKGDALHIAYTRQGTPASIRWARVSPLPAPGHYHLFPRSNTPPSSVPATDGKALRLEEHQRIDTTWKKPDGGTDMSVGMWIRAKRNGVLMDARKPGAGGVLFQLRPTKNGAVLSAFFSTAERDIESTLAVPTDKWCYVGLGIDNRAGIAHFVLNDRAEERPFSKPGRLAGDTVRFGFKRIDQSSCPGFSGEIRWAGVFDARCLSQGEHRALFNARAHELGRQALPAADPPPKPSFELDPSKPGSMAGLLKAGDDDMRVRTVESDGRQCVRFNGEASAGVDLDRNRPADGDAVEFEFEFKLGAPPTAKDQVVLCTTGGGDRPLRVVIDGGSPALVQTRLDGRLAPVGPLNPNGWSRIRLRIARESCEVSVDDTTPTRMTLPTSDTWLYLGQGYLEGRVRAGEYFSVDLRSLRSRVLGP